MVIARLHYLGRCWRESAMLTYILSAIMETYKILPRLTYARLQIVSTKLISAYYMVNKYSIASAAIISGML
jgi:hypothetical protein